MRSHVLDVGLVKPLVDDGEDAEGHGGGGIERQHDGRQGIGRHGRQRTQSQLARHGQSAVGIDVIAEIDTDNADAGHRLGDDLLSARGLIAPAFDAVGDGFFDGGCGHSLVVGDDLHGGRFEDGQNVHRDAQQREYAEEEDHENDGRHHVGVTQRRLDEPHADDPFREGRQAVPEIRLRLLVMPPLGRERPRA